MGMMVATMVWSRAATNRASPRASMVAAILKRPLGVCPSSASASEGACWYADSGVVVAAAAAAAPETVEVRWASWMSFIVMFGVSFLLEAVLLNWSAGAVVSISVLVVSRFADDSFRGDSAEAMFDVNALFFERVSMYVVFFMQMAFF